MLFNSFEFLIFLPLVFILYWFVFGKSLKQQNLFVVAVSYIFYGWWDWRPLMLIALTTLLSYSSGRLIEYYTNDRSRAKLVNVVNITINLVILGIFKYFNFFAASFVEQMNSIGWEVGWTTVNVILPVGVSFYTFQALSYSIDVYRGSMKATKDVVAFFAYVSFFPQLVAGPIERATNLLPQFENKRTFDYAKAVDGMRQMLWGFFKKIVIADSCAIGVNKFFEDYSTQTSSTLWLGAILFTFQIYCDFSGYSDIAIGSSRLFGISLNKNFNFPYFSRDIAEFWRRWHISLSSWFRDYVYIPLGGSRGTKVMVLRNTFVIFGLSGLWHGANWTFVVWGLYHAFLFIPLMLMNRNRRNTGVVADGKMLPSLMELMQMATTFFFVVIGWVIFRADTIAEAVGYIKGMFTPTILTMPSFASNFRVIYVIPFIMFLVLVEWFQRNKDHALQLKGYSKFSSTRPARYVTYIMVLFFIMLYMSGEPAEFIYFQF